MRHRIAAKTAYPQIWRNCVGAWAPLLGPNGTMLMDQSGRRNHGTLTNMDPATDWVVSGGYYALDLDGTDDFIQTTAVLFPGSSERVYSLWFSTTTTSASQLTMLAHGTSAAYQRVDISIQGSVQRIGLYIDSANNIFTATNCNDGNWHHLLLSLRAAEQIGNARMWMDGVQLTSFSSVGGTQTLNTGTSPVRIGNNLANTQRFPGLIDDVMCLQMSAASSIVKRLSRQRGAAYQTMRKYRYGAAAAGGFQSAWARGSNVLIGAPGY